MSHDSDSLSLFHPLVGQWFQARLGRPTEAQAESWPKIAAGEHLLIVAPTGSGKTLAAFLWAVNQLITQVWPSGRTGVLYVSPLKALNNDVQRNLIGPLAELRKVFSESGHSFPDIKVLTRSGDTPASDRRRMLRHPPEILITTPESLNLLLSSNGGRGVLTGLKAVILDEVHAVAGNKRGVHLITAVERLVALSGEFQRLALSATVRPVEAMAEFIGGFRLEGPAAAPRYTPRPVALVRSEEARRYELRVRFPQEARADQPRDSIWEPLTDEFKKVIGGNRSTLFFTNSRRLCEKITHLVNGGEDRLLAYAHHGSLSREIRTEVEARLKSGELKAIVATNSLELGLDVGVLDEVVLVQTPPTISSTVQRLGRSGHEVGRVSRGVIFPTHDQDLLEAAVLAAGVVDHDLEELRPVAGCLDVLAQIIVSMAGQRTWPLDELFARLRTGHPYRRLSREQFDLVINMLAGRYADTRLRELKPRLSLDRLSGTVKARKGAMLDLYTSGGVIPDRGYFHLRREDTGALIGELDEEFVWEDARVGLVFTLGAQNWKITRLTHNDVFVLPGPSQILAAPFWKGEERARDFHLSEKIGLFLETADERINDPEFADRLKKDYFLDESAAARLLDFLRRQKEATLRPLPHRRHLLIERVSSGPGGYPGHQIILHAVWGLRVLRPLALALEAGWEERFGQGLEVYTGNDCLSLVLPREVGGAELLSLVTPANLEPLLRKKMEGSGFFGARFRECAGRALLLPRGRLNRRMPLWMTRLRAQKLLQAVQRYDDFPILLETWRTCLRDEFQLDCLIRVLSELETGAITWSECWTTGPSPMARSLSWRQISEYMYRDDQPAGASSSRLRGGLLREVVFSPELRPAVSRDIVRRFEEKRRRLVPGYAPNSAEELLDWVKERLAVPADEWEALLAAMRQDHGLSAEAALGPIGDRVVRFTPPRAAGALVAALERWPILAGVFYDRDGDLAVETLSGRPITEANNYNGAAVETIPADLIAEWLQFYGPVTADFIAGTLGLDEEMASTALADLIEDEKLISGRLTRAGGTEELCDAENFEILLRLARSESAPVVEARPLQELQLFLAAHQGLTRPETGPEGLYARLEQLAGLNLPAGLWESEILPARLDQYQTSWLDTLMQETDLRWIGGENKRIAFVFEPDLDLLVEEKTNRGRTEANGVEPDNEPSGADERLADLLPDPAGRYDYITLLRKSGGESGSLYDRLWAAVWRGSITNDTFMALRRGLESRFQAPGVTALTSTGRGRHGRPRLRSGYARWKSAQPSAGNWFRLPWPDISEDALELEERNKDRVRLLLDRYGLVFKELLAREAPERQWSSLFRSLRLMELSGEVLAGSFFHGLPGLQFMSPQAFNLWQRRLPDEAMFWLNAADPVSLCGLGIEALKGALPKRLDSTHLVYHGARLVMVSERQGRSLTLYVPADDSNLPAYYRPLRHLLSRQFQPLRRIKIETINGQPAGRGPYLESLRACFEVVLDYKSLVLFPRRSR
ncbi:MAG: DEAD/DEAH box helicase [Thermodesulfobacteriota bacterium]